MDYGDMFPKSQFGLAVLTLMAVWGMVIVGMFVSVVFDSATFASYEVWAVDWLKQCELLECEREAAVRILQAWVRFRRQVRDEARWDDRALHTFYEVKAAKRYKVLLEIQYKITRLGGGDLGMPQ